MQPKSYTGATRWLSASLALVALGALSANAQYADAVKTDGALAYYRFNDSLVRSNVHVNQGSAGVAANATNTFNVRAISGALAGDSDAAQFFDTGNSFAMIPYNAALNPDNSKPFTVEAWFYPASDQISSGQCMLNNRYAPSGGDRTGWVMFQRAPNATYEGKSGYEGVGWNFRMYRGSGGSSGLDVTSQVPYNVGEWTHVVIVYDPVDPITNATLTMYINGVPAATNVWTGGTTGTDLAYAANATDTDVALSLGAYNNSSGAGGNAYFGGIDEFAIYPSKLSPEVILSHYQNGSNAARTTAYADLVKASSPAAFLRLDEPTPGPNVAINMGDIRNAGLGTHSAEVRRPTRGAVAADAKDGAVAYHNRNGNSVTTIPYNADNNPDASVPFTFETWLKPARDQQGGQCPVNNRWVGGTGRTGWVIFQRNPNRSYPTDEGYGYCFRMFTGNGNSGQDVLTEVDYEVGQWGHLVITWEPQLDNGDPAGNGNWQWQGILTAYFNGVAVSSNTAALYAANRAETEDGNPAADLGIGAYNAASGLGNNPYEGQIDELAIYRGYVLTPDQILEHYMVGTNAHPATNYSTLVFNAANDGTSQRLMPKTYLRFMETPFMSAVNAGSLGYLADGSLVVSTNDIPGPNNAMFGANNSALAVDGLKGWASLGAPNSLSLAGQITLEAWVKPGETQGDKARIISYGPPVLSNFLNEDGSSKVETNSSPTVAAEVALAIVETGTSYSVGSYDGTNFYGVKAAIPVGDLGSSQWIHLVGTYDGANWKLYRNGTVLGTSAATVGSFIIPQAEWGVGSAGSGWADPFAGSIDEVAVYGKALTAAQVQAHYSGTFEPPRVDIERHADGKIFIRWSAGTLQEAEQVNGTYSNVPNNPTSPYEVPAGLVQKFYRTIQ